MGTSISTKEKIQYNNGRPFDLDLYNTEKDLNHSLVTSLDCRIDDDSEEYCCVSIKPYKYIDLLLCPSSLRNLQANTSCECIEISSIHGYKEITKYLGKCQAF